MTEIRKLTFDELIIDPQVRTTIDQNELDQLAMTMKEVGQLQPIGVCPLADKYKVIYGERRSLAATIAGLETIDAKVYEAPLDEVQILELQLIENIQRLNLRPMELASGVANLMRRSGKKSKEVAKTVGMSMSSMSRAMALLELPKLIQQKIDSGAVPQSAAPELLRLEDPVKQLEMAEKLEQGVLTRDGIVALRRAREHKASAADRPTVRRAVAVLGGNQTVTVAADELSLGRFIEVLQELVAKARKALTQGMELETFQKMLKDQCTKTGTQNVTVSEQA